MTTSASISLYIIYISCYRVAAAPDFSFFVSCSHDGILKSWYTTPRHPDPPAAPRVLAVTDTTALLSWVSPPCFNLDVNAFHVQWRGGHRDQWVPIDDGLSVPPHYRTKVSRYDDDDDDDDDEEEELFIAMCMYSSRVTCTLHD